MNARERITRSLAIHVALLTIAAIFVFPFLWMLSASMKTDEEVGRQSLPSIPTFRATSDRAKPLEILGVELRTIDFRIAKVVTESKSVDYDFSTRNEPLVATYEFDAPVKWNELHKLAIAIKPDDSWHGIDASLELDGKRFTSAYTSYLAQTREMTMVFQPPGPDDQSLKARTWVPMRVTDAASGRAKLTITITPSSTPRAIYAKVTRNYSKVFSSIPFWRYVGNSTLLVALNVAGMVFSSSFVGYAFARMNWPGRGVAMVVLLSTMMIPPQVTIAPTFMIIRALGWYNTFNPLWVPAWLGSAFFIFLMVQHLKTLPRELEEAARIDGLNYVQTWYYIMLPQIKPAAAAIAILTFMASWNDFMGPLIFLRDQAMYPLSLGLYDLQLNSGNDQSIIMAGNVLMTLPVLVIFFLFQRYFVSGITMSGMK
jgi:multiple sugar transport system permease protein